MDSLLSVQISTNGGQSYSTYSVSSLKDGLTFDCSPKDLKVICDVNTLKYIQVLADGEKASNSDIDLSDYIKNRDIYVDVYKNPYYHSKELPDDVVSELSEFERRLYEAREDYEYYCNSSEDFNPNYWNSSLKIFNSYGGYYENLQYIFHSIGYFDGEDVERFLFSYYGDLNFDSWYPVIVGDYGDYVNSDGYWFYTNARIRFIKHF